MRRDEWISLWDWVKIYLRQILSCAPRKHDAARAAGISDEKLVTHERRTGVYFCKPIRKFFRMKPMPDHMVRFIEEDEQYHRARSSNRSASSLEPPRPISQP